MTRSLGGQVELLEQLRRDGHAIVRGSNVEVVRGLFAVDDSIRRRTVDIGACGRHGFSVVLWWVRLRQGFEKEVNLSKGAAAGFSPSFIQPIHMFEDGPLD